MPSRVPSVTVSVSYVQNSAPTSSAAMSKPFSSSTSPAVFPSVVSRSRQSETGARYSILPSLYDFRANALESAQIVTKSSRQITEPATTAVLI